MPDHKVPPTVAPYFATPVAAKPTPVTETPNPDVGTTALVKKLQGELDAAFSRKSEPAVDAWQIERDASVELLKGTLLAIERQTKEAVSAMQAERIEHAKMIREVMEQQEKRRPKRIRAPSGKVYEVES